MVLLIILVKPTDHIYKAECAFVPRILLLNKACCVFLHNSYRF